ncbi:hypothetical protein HPB50_027146 [Hyalomma asiaticum]|uniref:Uncharacterized protein n=1 Tax=Hyalomma asiaticum TaxID=266040 RepID=A0ACB7TV34_HYAAI|nr:hypothetical protein HPB50_027146 [Hyalomma asiaticum]
MSLNPRLLNQSRTGFGGVTSLDIRRKCAHRIQLDVLHLRISVWPALKSSIGSRDRRRLSPADAEEAFADAMDYSVEGETITPEALQGADWKKIVSKRHEDFYRRKRREAAECRAITAIQQLTDSSSSAAEKAQQNGRHATNGNKTNTRKRPPIPRLPRDYRKIVVGPRNLNLRSISPGTLLATVCAQPNLPIAVIRREDQLRINPYNTFTISTPCDERAQLYLNIAGLRLNNVDHPVMAYLPAPDNAHTHTQTHKSHRVSPQRI